LEDGVVALRGGTSEIMFLLEMQKRRENALMKMEMKRKKQPVVIKYGRNTESSGISLELKELECGPMPNLMVALPNIGGALCSTPQSLADAHY